MDSGGEARRLRQEIERALRRAFDPADVLPRLARLARIACPKSDDGVFAHRQLAELLAPRHPWRAALYAKRAIAHRGDDDRAWAILAFSQTLLGNFHCAARAYRQAIACAPGNPWYAHNLGHLLDVALGQPARALPLLRSAHAATDENAEVVASYAHALARAGEIVRARAVLERAQARFPSRELAALLRWIDQGAPSRGVATRQGPRQRRSSRDRRLDRVLERGLSRLPFDSRQRERALALARDVLPAMDPIDPTRSNAGVAGLAAAVAYAIVYVDDVPLSQAEVAAPFRVAVARLRGRFAELRAKLDIIPGDARYASTRT